jgi:copper chaperone
MTRTTLGIDGMSCGHCVASVKKALAALDGVTVENVAIGSATVAYDPSVVSPEKIADAISDAGYTAVRTT